MLRENAILEEGHCFSRAVNNTAIPGFSRRGTVFPSSEFSHAVSKALINAAYSVNTLNP